MTTILIIYIASIIIPAFFAIYAFIDNEDTVGIILGTLSIIPAINTITSFIIILMFIGFMLRK